MKKGFTLIELLAVIVILAIVSLIATPLIMDVIDDAQKEAFKNSAYGIIEAAELTYIENKVNGIEGEMTFTYEDGNETATPNGMSLGYKGQKPKSGNVVIEESGKISLAIHNGKYCAYKNSETDLVTVLKIEEGDCEEKRTLVYTDTSCFTFDESTRTITKYDMNSCSKEVIIPEEINGVRVEHLGPASFADVTDQTCSIFDEDFESLERFKVDLDYIHTEDDEYFACLYDVNFSNNIYIRSVKLPHNLKTIENGAFYYDRIAELEIPDGVTFIGDFAFAGNNIKNLVIPDSVTKIGYYAFVGSELESVHIGKGVTNLEFNPFTGNPNLTTITVAEDNPAYMSINNAIYTKDGTTLVAGTKSMSDDILDTVTVIRMESMAGLYLDDISLPDNLTKIGAYAFYYNNLTSVEFPDKLETIGADAFEYNLIEEIDLSDSVTKIGNFAFNYNTLKSVHIGEGVTNIGYNPFAGNPNLTTITVAEDNLNYMSINNNAIYTIDGITLVSGTKEMSTSILEDTEIIAESAFEYMGLTGVNIPGSVTTIKNGAFCYNKLMSISISNNVTSIGRSAFCWNKLNNVEIGNNVTSMELNPFFGNPNLTTITVAEDNPAYMSINNAIYTKDGTTLITGTKGMRNSIYENTEIIGRSAFESMGLTDVTIPTNVTTIENWAFYDNGLTSISIPSSVTFIGDEAFCYNKIRQGNAQINNSASNVTLGYGVFHNNGLWQTTTITPIFSLN